MRAGQAATATTDSISPIAANVVLQPHTWQDLFGRSVVLYGALLVLNLATAGYVIEGDTLAYIIAAENYARFDFDLAVTGYWSPLVSWMMVPFIWLGIGNQVYGYIINFLMFSAFVLGTIRFLRGLPLFRPQLKNAVLCTAFMAAGASFFGHRPDLLVAGLTLLGLSYWVSGEAVALPRRAALAGIWLALAFMAKAVAFPIAVAGIPVLAALNVLLHRCKGAAAIRAGAVSLAVFLLASAPWITILSTDQGHLTFSNVGAIGLAVVNPSPQTPREYDYHPLFRDLIGPTEGRITTWEDPTELIHHYELWSPFSSWQDFKDYLTLVGTNIARIVFQIRWLDAVGCALAFSLAALLANVLRYWKRRKFDVDIVFAFAAVGLLIWPFAASQAMAGRYLYGAFAVIIAISLHGAAMIRAALVQRPIFGLRSERIRAHLGKALVTVLIASLLTVTALRVIVEFLLPRTDGYRIAVSLVRQDKALFAASERIASIGDRPHFALYLSYLLKKPYWGDVSGMGFDPTRFERADIDTIVIPKKPLLAENGVYEHYDIVYYIGDPTYKKNLSKLVEFFLNNSNYVAVDAERLVDAGPSGRLRAPYYIFLRREPGKQQD